MYQISVLVLSALSSSLSILGSFAIFGSYIFISDIRNSTRKLVTCLTVADFLSAFGYLASAVAHFANTQERVCTPQSVITTYSSIVSFYLTVAIAIHIFATVVSRQNTTSSMKFLLCANVISWVIPGIILIIAGTNDVLGSDYAVTGTDPNNTNAFSVNTGPWCWIKRDNKNYIFWVFFAGKGWEFLCYLITTSLYVLLKFNMYLRYRRQTFTDIHESLRKDDQNYLYVWFVLYVLRLWGSVRSMMNLAGVDTTYPGREISDKFMYLQAFGDPGQAFCNCILFCFLDGTVRSYIRNAWCGKPPDPVQLEETERLVAADSINARADDWSQDSSDAEGDNSGQSIGFSGKYSSFGSIMHGSITLKRTSSDKESKKLSVQYADS